MRFANLGESCELSSAGESKLGATKKYPPHSHQSDNKITKPLLSRGPLGVGTRGAV